MNSETIKTFELRLHIKTLKDEKTSGLSHMTKMAAMLK